MAVNGFQARRFNKARAIRKNSVKSKILRSILGSAAYDDHKASKSRDRQLQRKFGITLLEYETLLKSQDGRCAICRRSPGAEEKRLAVDHCHTTGKVRGILCRHCNWVLGYAGDSIEVLQAAVGYLQK